MGSKPREQIIADIRRTRDEMQQIFSDVDSWNENSESRKRGAAAITYDDVDPGGWMRRQIEIYNGVLAEEDARPIPPVDGID